MRYDIRIQALASIAAGLLAGGCNLQDQYLADRAVKILAALELADDKARVAAEELALANFMARQTNHGAF